MNRQQKNSVFTQLDALYHSMTQAKRLEWLFNHAEKGAGLGALDNSGYEEICKHVYECDDHSFFDSSSNRAYDNIEDYYRIYPEARAELEPDYDTINDNIKLAEANG
jgi:hypothetical protein